MSPDKSFNAARATQITLACSALAAAWCLRPRSETPGKHRPIVLITGGASGLGLELARVYGRAGARLILVSRSQSHLEDARNALFSSGDVKNAADILLLPANLSDKDAAKQMIEIAISHLQRIDVLINCAGVIEVGPIEDQPLEAFESAMRNNFFTALYTTQSALPYLLSQPALEGHRGRRASIVNISSIGGKVAVPHLLPYSASKFALTGYSEGLHAELRSKGIRVTTVCPGLMRTGSQVRARFVGNVEKEKAWFDFGATTPGAAASVQHSARRIRYAQLAGSAETIITPQAWLAARVTGLAPGLTAIASSLANHLILPAPPGNRRITPHSQSAIGPSTD